MKQRRNWKIFNALLGTCDMMLAGQARASGLILVPNKVKVFESVPGLMLKDWSVSD